MDIKNIQFDLIVFIFQELLSNIEELKSNQYKDMEFEVYHEYMESDLIFSQTDMALVQIAFFASVIMFPK